MIASELTLLVLRSKDVHASRRFYAALGIEFVSEKHGSGPEHFAGKIGDTVLEIYPADQAAEPSNVRLGFSIHSLRVAMDLVADAGGRLLSEPKTTSWGVRAVVEDPDGNKIELVEKAQQAVAADRPKTGAG